MPCAMTGEEKTEPAHAKPDVSTADPKQLSVLNGIVKSGWPKSGAGDVLPDLQRLRGSSDGFGWALSTIRVAEPSRPRALRNELESGLVKSVTGRGNTDPVQAKPTANIADAVRMGLCSSSERPKCWQENADVAGPVREKDLMSSELPKRTKSHANSKKREPCWAKPKTEARGPGCTELLVNMAESQFKYFKTGAADPVCARPLASKGASSKTGSKAGNEESKVLRLKTGVDRPAQVIVRADRKLSR